MAATTTGDISNQITSVRAPVIAGYAPIASRSPGTIGTGGSKPEGCDP